MNFEQYKRWLEKKANREERGALEVVKAILKHHNSDGTWKEFFFPRTVFKGMEFDLIIFLAKKKKKLEEADYFDRVIGVEFKETDVKRVIKQAILRKEYVDYQYIATRDVYMDYPDVFLLTLFGIGWVVWGKGFAKIVVPARMRDISYRVDHLVNELINVKLKGVIEDAIQKKLTEFLKKS